MMYFKFIEQEQNGRIKASLSAEDILLTAVPQMH